MIYNPEEQRQATLQNIFRCAMASLHMYTHAKKAGSEESDSGSALLRHLCQAGNVSMKRQISVISLLIRFLIYSLKGGGLSLQLVMSRPAG